MRRATGILIGILLGALAATIGIGIFLKKANDDRERLAMQVDETTRQANESLDKNRQLIEDANAKLQAANLEVTKAQNLVKSLEEERELMATATPLTAAPKTIRGWNDVIAVGLNLSLKIPSGYLIDSNDAQSLTVTSQRSEFTDPRWLSITPYDVGQEQEWLSTLATSTPVSYLVDGHILTGVRGILVGQTTPIFVLRARQNGTVSHVVWIREQSGLDEKTVLTILATLHFET